MPAPPPLFFPVGVVLFILLLPGRSVVLLLFVSSSEADQSEADAHTTVSSAGLTITLHYGPSSINVVEESAMFTVAALLLQKSTPHVEFEVLPTTDRLTRLPLVRLPSEALEKVLQNKGRPAEWLRGTAATGPLSFNGRPALVFGSQLYGRLLVTTAGNWENVRTLLCGAGTTFSTSSPVVLHAEVVVLWYDGEMLHHLRFEDLQPLPMMSSSYVADRSPRQRSISPQSSPGNSPSRRGPSPRLVPSKSTGHAYSVTLRVSDVQGIHRGEVAVPLLDPPISKQELLEMVRAATGVRHHRCIRLAYRIFSPSVLRSSSPSRSRVASESPQRRGRSPGRNESPPRGLADSVCSLSPSMAAGPLKPIENDKQVHQLILDVLAYGCRTIRLVAAEVLTADQLGNTQRSASSGSRPSPSCHVEAPSRPASAEHVTRAADETQGGKDTVVIQYEVDPTELWVSGPVTESMLNNLTKAIKSVCEAGSAEKAADGKGPAFSIRTPRLHLQEKQGQRIYLFDLHEYTFSEEQESLMEKYITEVMQSVEGLKQTAKKDGQPKIRRSVAATSNGAILCGFKSDKAPPETVVKHITPEQVSAFDSRSTYSGKYSFNAMEVVSAFTPRGSLSTLTCLSCENNKINCACITALEYLFAFDFTSGFCFLIPRFVFVVVHFFSFLVEYFNGMLFTYPNGDVHAGEKSDSTQSPLSLMRMHSTLMRRYLHQEEPLKALLSASQMLMHLREDCSHSAYAPLYNHATSEMKVLYSTLRAMRNKGLCSVGELFEVAQGIGYVIPRAYLLITIGTLLQQEQHADIGPATSSVSWSHAVFQEMLLVAKSVLHPLRGLYLRHLLITAPFVLPGEAGYPATLSPEQRPALIKKSTELLVANFSSVVALATRLSVARRAADKEKGIATAFKSDWTKQKERNELEQFVGASLRRLSMELLPRTEYCSTVAPVLLQAVVDFPDPSGQQYILASAMEMFPPDFHLYSASQVAATIAKMHPSVDQRGAYQKLMELIASCLEDQNAESRRSSSSPDPSIHSSTLQTREAVDPEVQANIFTMLLEELDKTPTFSTEQSASPALEGGQQGEGSTTVFRGPFVLSFFAFAESLLEMSFNHLKDGKGALGKARTVQLLKQVSRRISQMDGNRAVGHAVAILLSMIATYSADLESFVLLEGVLELMQNLPHNERREITILMCSKASRLHGKGVPPFSSVEGVQHFFEFCRDTFLLSQDHSVTRSAATVNTTKSIEAEIKALSQLISAIDHKDPEVLVSMLRVATDIIHESHSSLVGSLAMRLLDPVASIAKDGGSGAQALARQAVEVLHVGNGKGLLEEMALQDPSKGCRAYIQLGSCSDALNLPETVDASFTEAFKLLESCGGESTQVELMQLICSALRHSKNIDEESYMVFALGACRQCGLVMQKDQQCRLQARCAALFHRSFLSPEAQDRGKGCLERARKLSRLVPDRLSLLLELLSLHLAYFDAKAPFVAAAEIVELIENVQSLLELAERTNTNAHRDPQATVDKRGGECPPPAVIFETLVKDIKAKAASDERIDGDPQLHALATQLLVERQRQTFFFFAISFLADKVFASTRLLSSHVLPLVWPRYILPLLHFPSSLITTARYSRMTHFMGVDEDLVILRQLVDAAAATCTTPSSDAASSSPAVPAPSSDFSKVHTPRADTVAMACQVADLTRQVAALTAQLAAAQCSVTTAELHCKGLRETIAACQADATAATAERQKLVLERDDAMRRLAAAQRRAAAMEHRLSSLEKDYALLEGDCAAVFEHQLADVAACEGELRCMAQSLGEENVALKDRLEAKATVEAALEAAESERVRWQKEAEACRTERDAWEGDWAEAQHCAQQCRDLAAQLQAFWEASQQEMEALRATVEKDRQLLTQWEEGFGAATLPELPPLPPVLDRVDQTSPALPASRSHSPTHSSDPTPVKDNMALLELLEAKTVDLALALHAATAVADARAEQYNALAAQHLEAVSCRTPAHSASVEGLETLAAALQEKNQELQATAVATEHFCESLFEIHEHLLHEYTQEVHHTHELENALVQRVMLPGPSPPLHGMSSSGPPPVGGATTRKQSRFILKADALRPLLCYSSKFSHSICRRDLYPLMHRNSFSDADPKTAPSVPAFLFS
eukprot:gene4026-2880_t